MFRGLFRKHTRTIIDERGNRSVVPATCDEINHLFSSHVWTWPESDGNGGVRDFSEVLSCAEMDGELTRTIYANEQFAAQVERLTGQLTKVTEERDNGVRLMANALQVIFGMRPVLRKLLADDLREPQLTSDRTAVKLECDVYYVIIDVFKELLLVGSTADGETSVKAFTIRNGRIDMDSQKLLIGEVTCIKLAAAGGVNPVQEAIDLLAPAGAAE